MRRYFEYPVGADVYHNLLKFYEEQGSHQISGTNNMHENQHFLKMSVKLKRAYAHLGISRHDRILDVGCSGGALLDMIAQECENGTGLDISSVVIEACQKKNQFPNIEYRVFDGVNIPFVNTYDKVFMLDVLEHAFEPNNLMENVTKTLKTNGVLILQVPTTGWLSELLFGKYHMGHLRYYDDNYLKGYIENFGFEIIACDVYNSVPLASRLLRYPRLYKVLDRLCNFIPHRCFPYFGSIMIIAQKKSTDCSVV